MKKALPEIRESVFELKQLLRTEKKSRRRERLHMLYLFRTGQAIDFEIKNSDLDSRDL